MTINDSDMEQLDGNTFGFAFDRVVFDLKRGCLTVDGNEVAAPPLPLKLLQVLCEQPGILLTRTCLFDSIWPHQVVSDEALTKIVGRLRDLLGPYGPRVVTVRGRGIRFDATVRRLSTGADPDCPSQDSVCPTFASRPTILIVDDAADSIALLSEVLKDEYQTRIATNGPSALKAALRSPRPDLVLLDVSMPHMDGYEVCSRLKSLSEIVETPIMFLTARTSPADEERGFAVGGVDYVAKPISPQILRARVATHLALARARVELRNQNARLERLGEQKAHALARIQDATIIAMATLAERRNDGSRSHVQRTQNFVALLARELREHPRFSHELTDESIALLLKSVPLHDIGKIAVPDDILCRSGPLTEAELETVKRHITRGGDAIRAVESYLGESCEFLRFSREIAYSHQEHWDGSGYPEGLAGDEIPISARLMAIADVYDALISHRRYRPAFSHEQAVALMERARGAHFDPDILDAFLRLENEFRSIAERFGGQSSLP